MYTGPDVVKLLLDSGVDVNAKDKYGYTALMRAAEHGNLEIVKLLLDNNADVNAIGDKGTYHEGDTVLDVAMKEVRFEYDTGGSYSFVKQEKLQEIIKLLEKAK